MSDADNPVADDEHPVTNDDPAVADGGTDRTDGASDGSETGELGTDEDTFERTPYVESPIIMSTVRVVAPFVFTFGLFVMFHGADSAGGGFQGGVIVGTVVLMLGIAFGIDTTRQTIGPVVPVALIGLGVLAFLGAGVGSVLLGEAFLQYDAYPIYHASKYGIEFVELGIGVIVAGVVTGLFFALAAGISGDGGESI